MITHRIAKLACVGLTILALAGCNSHTHHNRRANNTMLGAGLGAAAGAVISQGNPWYAVGGAAAGGLLGNILTEDDKRRPRQWNSNHSQQRSWNNHRQSRHQINHRSQRPSHGDRARHRR